MRNNLTDVYEKTLEKDFLQIGLILKDIGVVDRNIEDSCKSALTQSCANITNKWSSGRKYTRTLFVREAYGDSYPENVLQDSILIDAMVNILDDLLDENLEKEEKTLYVLEFLRVFALHNFEKVSIETQTLIGSYFYKLITLAVIEGYYDNLLNNEEELDNLVRYSIEVLDCRSMDIDIFNNLALRDCGLDMTEEEKLDIVRVGRMFRAVNIMKKDIDDMEHDQATGQESLALKVYLKQKENFQQYILRILEHYRKESSLIKKKRENIIVFGVFCGMIERENENIVKKMQDNA